MADIASSISKMNDLEVGVDAPLSEAVNTKVGANINGLIDEDVSQDTRLGYLETGNYRNSQNFAANDTWVCPSHVNRVLVIGCGGGGGGIQGVAGTTIGVGGHGAPLVASVYDVTPTTGYAIVIGAGGAATGADGDNTTFDAAGVIMKGGRGGVATAISEDIFIPGGKGAYPGCDSESFTGGSLTSLNWTAGTGAIGGGAGPYGDGADSAISAAPSASANTGGGGGGTTTTGTAGAGGSGQLTLFW